MLAEVPGAVAVSVGGSTHVRRRPVGGDYVSRLVQDMVAVQRMQRLAGPIPGNGRVELPYVWTNERSLHVRAILSHSTKLSVVSILPSSPTHSTWSASRRHDPAQEGETVASR